MNTTRTQRARGVVWGQATGDALGTTVEFASAAAIAARSPDGWPVELIGAGPFALLPGQVTDDTELALALARSLVEHGRYDEDAVAGAYVRWARSGPFDIGQATTRAFGGPLETSRGAASQVEARADPVTQANGSLMRSSPLSVFGLRFPRETLAGLAARDSRLSHPHPVCQAACAVFVTTLAEAVREGASGPALYAGALAFSATSPLAAPVHDTLLAAQHGLPVSDQQSQGWVRVALQHAFFHLRHATDFEAALVQTVRCGGDTDTNAAIVGALLGGVLGEDAIPRRWRDAVQGCPSPRPSAYHCADLPTLAETLEVAGA